MERVLVTGASRGIGLETALAFARAGYRVVAGMRRPEQASELPERAASEGLTVTVVQLDVDSDDSVARCFAAHPEVDVLVNNAGVEFVGSVEETPLAMFRSVMETNYFGALRCTQAALAGMRGRGLGAIVNVSSVSGRIAPPALGPYCASKWALEAMSEVLAAEVHAANVRVILIEPGIIDTAMARRISEPKPDSTYPQTARMATVFQNSLEQPVPPTAVADTIVEAVQSGSRTLRYVVGPNAGPLLKWRASMTDEQWVELNGADDATYFASTRR